MWLILSTASVVFCSQLVESSKTKPIPLVFLLKAQNDFPRCRPAGTYSGQGILNVSQGGRNAMQLISGKAKTRVNEKKKRCRVKDLLWHWLRLLSGITASPCTDEAADPWTALLFCSLLALTFTEQSLNKGGCIVLFCCMHLVSPKLHWFELSTKQLQIKKGKEKKKAMTVQQGAVGCEF